MLHIKRAFVTAVEEQVQNGDTVLKFTPELRVDRVATIIKPFDGNTSVCEKRLVEIILCGRPGHVGGGAGGKTNA